MTSEGAEEMMGQGKKLIIIKAESDDEWKKVLKKLGNTGITSILLEGGNVLASSFIKAGVVNKAAFFIAPKILGKNGSNSLINEASPASLKEAFDLKNIKTEMVGEDLLVTGYF